MVPCLVELGLAIYLKLNHSFPWSGLRESLASEADRDEEGHEADQPKRNLGRDGAEGELPDHDVDDPACGDRNEPGWVKR